MSYIQRDTGSLDKKVVKLNDKNQAELIRCYLP